jgi:hypothetical protein
MELSVVGHVESNVVEDRSAFIIRLSEMFEAQDEGKSMGNC